MNISAKNRKHVQCGSWYWNFFIDEIFALRHRISLLWDVELWLSVEICRAKVVFQPSIYVHALDTSFIKMCLNLNGYNFWFQNEHYK